MGIGTLPSSVSPAAYVATTDSALATTSLQGFAPTDVAVSAISTIGLGKWVSVETTGNRAQLVRVLPAADMIHPILEPAVSTVSAMCSDGTTLLPVGSFQGEWSSLFGGLDPTSSQRAADPFAARYTPGDASEDGGRFTHLWSGGDDGANACVLEGSDIAVVGGATRTIGGSVVAGTVHTSPIASAKLSENRNEESRFYTEGISTTFTGVDSIKSGALDDLMLIGDSSSGTKIELFGCEYHDSLTTGFWTYHGDTEFTNEISPPGNCCPRTYIMGCPTWQRAVRVCSPRVCQPECRPFHPIPLRMPSNTRARRLCF